MRRHATNHHSVQRFATWVSQIVGTNNAIVEKVSHVGVVRQGPFGMVRTFAASPEQNTTQQTSSSEELEPPPGMFAVISSMIAGAGGAVLVAGIGYVHIIIMRLLS